MQESISSDASRYTLIALTWRTSQVHSNTFSVCRVTADMRRSYIVTHSTRYCWTRRTGRTNNHILQFQMDFGKDEVTVSSAITPPLYCFLLKVNAATGSEKKTKKNTTFATLVYSETHSKQTLSRAVRKTHLQGLSTENLHMGKQELLCTTNPTRLSAIQCRFYTARKH